MTVVRLANSELFLHSPVLLDASIRAALHKLGPVQAIVAPSSAHHLFVGDYLKAYPDARLHGAPGLAKKRQNLKFDVTLGDQSPNAWLGQIEQHLFRGAPFLNEVVFFHLATRTLIFTDLVFNLTREGAAQARVFNWLTGATGHLGPHRLIRRMISDHNAARASVETILRWDFDRVIVGHGDLIEGDSRALLRAAFAYLWS